MSFADFSPGKMQSKQSKLVQGVSISAKKLCRIFDFIKFCFAVFCRHI